MTKTFKVLLADDHDLMVEGLSELVNSLESFEVIATANNGVQAVKMADWHRPDLVLMDINMPKQNGIESTEIIKKKYPEIHVLVLTMDSDPALIRQVMSMGASGFLSKTANRKEMVLALEMVMSGKKYYCSSASEALAEGKDLHKEAINRTKISSQEKVNLSAREEEVLVGVAEGFSNKELAEKLFISPRTVDSHRTNIMKKIQVHNTAGIVRYALKNGYL